MEFRAIVAGVLILVAPLLRAGEPIHAIFILEGESRRASLRRGIEFGIAEARHTAGLFQREFVMHVVEVADSLSAQKLGVARAHGPARVAYIGFAGSGATAVALTHPEVPVVAVLERGDAGPAGSVYRLRPDDATIKASQTYGTAPRGSRVVAWHPDLQRYGARELNRRFRKATGEAMDEDAWLGWLAVKVILEAALRRSEIASLRIDAHKGVPLRFDNYRLMRQPLYAVVKEGDVEVIHE